MSNRKKMVAQRSRRVCACKNAGGANESFFGEEEQPSFSPTGGNERFKACDDEMMRKVYVCAPLGGNVESNLKKVRAYTEYALRCGTAPVVPHFYAECLDDNDPKDREIGLAAGLSLLWFCDELWLFGDTVTDGMKNELQFCKNLNIRIRKITENEIQKVIGGNRL